MLLFGLLVFASDFGLDVVLGAFLAGVVLRRWAPGDVDALEGKLDALGLDPSTNSLLVRLQN